MTLLLCESTVEQESAKNVGHSLLICAHYQTVELLVS